MTTTGETTAMSDREKLARLISEGVDGMSREAYEEASQDYKNEMLEGADRILTSDWLKQVKAEALREIALATHKMPSDPYKAAEWLRLRADEIGGAS